MKGVLPVVLFIAISLPRPALAVDPESPTATYPAASPVDIVTLKNGSTIHGEVIEMAEGTFHIKTPASPDSWIKVKWLR